MGFFRTKRRWLCQGNDGDNERTYRFRRIILVVAKIRPEHAHPVDKSGACRGVHRYPRASAPTRLAMPHCSVGETSRSQYGVKAPR